MTLLYPVQEDSRLGNQLLPYEHLSPPPYEFQQQLNLSGRNLSELHLYAISLVLLNKTMEEVLFNIFPKDLQTSQIFYDTQAWKSHFNMALRPIQRIPL